MTRIYTPQLLEIGTPIVLEKDSSAHLSKVLRKKNGDTLIIFNGDGFNYEAEITAVGKTVSVQINQKRENHCESPLHITLVQGLSRGDRMDYALQKATELGVNAIQPLMTEKSAIKLDENRSEKKVRHWQSVVISACEQSGRSVVPTVEQPISLNEWFSRGSSDTNSIALDPTAEQSLAEITVSDRCAILIGPESGFSKFEVEMMSRKDIVRASLGPRVLRTETAAVAAIAGLQMWLGDLK